MGSLIEEGLEKIDILVLEESGYIEKKLSSRDMSDQDLSIEFSSDEKYLNWEELSNFQCLIIGTDIQNQIELDRVKDLRTPLIISLEDSKVSENWIRVADDYLLGRDLENFDLFEKRVLNTVRSFKKEDQLDKILDRVTDGFMAVNNEGKITYINNEMLRWLQKSREDILGEYIWDEFSGALGTDFEEKYNEAIETPQPVYVEDYYPPIDGWFAVKGYPSESGVTVYLRDITERKRKQDKLNEKLDQQEIINDLLRMAIEDRDILNIQYYAVDKVAEALNADCARILKKNEELGKLQVSAQINMNLEGVPEPMVEIDNEYIEGHVLFEQESAIVENFSDSPLRRTRIMEFLNISSAASSMIGEYGDPYGTISVFSHKSNHFGYDQLRFLESVANILATCNEVQEKNLKLREYRSVIDGVNYGIYMLDRDKKLIMANKAFEKITGFDRSQLKGRKYNVITEKSAGIEKIDIETSKGKRSVKTHSSQITLPDGTIGKVFIVLEDE